LLKKKKTVHHGFTLTQLDADCKIMMQQNHFKKVLIELASLFNTESLEEMYQANRHLTDSLAKFCR